MNVGVFLSELGIWLIVLSALGVAVHFARWLWGKRPRG